MTLQGMIPVLGARGKNTGARKGEEVELGKRKGALID
jgi:hypothetical protein